MAEPTIEDDLRHLFACVTQLSPRAYADVKAARDRIADALREREHLEEAARMLRAGEGGFSDEGFDFSLTGSFQHALSKWLERERARKQGSAVVKSTP